MSVNIFAGGSVPVTATITLLSDWDLLFPPVWYEMLNPADRRGSNLTIDIKGASADLTLEVQGKHSLTGVEFQVAEIVAPTSGGDYADQQAVFLPRYVRCGISHHSGTTTSVAVGFDATIRQVT